MAQVPSPTIRARRLRRELRRLRDRTGHTAEGVAKLLGWHRTKVIRFELGHSRVMPKDLPPLLDLYDADGEERESLTGLLRQSRQKGWWSAYGDVLPDDYVGFEAEATSISAFESLYVPGLLQTEEYVRAIVRAGRSTADQDETDRVVAARLARKALLSRDVPPSLWAVLDEAAVRRVVGGPKVMRAQLARLVEACEMPTVEIQVLPFTAGAHAAMGEPSPCWGTPTRYSTRRWSTSATTPARCCWKKIDRRPAIDSCSTTFGPRRSTLTSLRTSSRGLLLRCRTESDLLEGYR